ncbi:MAG: hypothetical protein JXB50_03850 [Spirochaetes bacterium]|nr:hypothetical protein [Spirochaetota bacterium]
MYKKIIIINFLLLLFSFKFYSQQTDSKSFLLLPGSKVYSRVFLFYFPLSDEYNIYFGFQKNTFNLEILIKKDDIKKEPFTPKYFESEILFTIKKISYNKSGRYVLPVSIRCNQKFIEKKVIFSIFFKDNVMIINGAFNDLYIKDITNNEYFKKRYNWKYQIYFDIRLQLGENLIEDMKKTLSN